MESRELLERDGVLCSPSVGIWRVGVAYGDGIPAGRCLGTLEILGRRVALVVPVGVRGVAVPVQPGGPRAVEYGQPLVEVGAATGLADDPDAPGAAGPARTEGGIAVTAPIDGIFYARPAPDLPDFVTVGAVLRLGATVGLLEVMKTFHPVAYGGSGLPDPARVVAIRAKDQQEVASGDVLIVVEPG